MSEPTPQFPPPPGPPVPPYRQRRQLRGSLWFPIALVVIGVVALLDQFGLLWWMRWDVLWPLVVIAVGVALIIRRWR
jgi:hypothetical protein